MNTNPFSPRCLRAAVACLALFALATPAAAQEERPQEPEPERPDTTTFVPATLVGQVLSSTTAEPVEGAVVTLVRTGYGAISDSLGNFRIPRTAAGVDSVEVRLIGYEPSKTEIRLEPNVTTRVVLLLSRTVVRVADITVEIDRARGGGRLAGFWHRQRLGAGYFLTPEEVEARRPFRYPSDLLRLVPGLQVGRRAFGQAPVLIGRGRGCEPSLFLNGQYMGSMRVDEIDHSEVGAVEVYRGPSETPGEFIMGRGADCGAIVIWSPSVIERP